MASEKIIEHFHAQGAICARLGSPFMARLCGMLADALPQSGTRVAEAVLCFDGDPRDAALALRLCGGLHALSWEDAALHAVYPPNEISDTDLATALIRALGDDRLLKWIDMAPQTNEVARSGVLLGGLLSIAAKAGPVALYEIGSSAGLNLFPERYHYDLGNGQFWGGGEAPVKLHCDWDGLPAPLSTELQVAGRAGCDLAPLDASDAEARARMLAYIWPDQPERLERARAALAIAAAERPAIARKGAADWLAEQASGILGQTAHPVILHSIMWGYLPMDERDRATEHISKIGGERPLSWLRVEIDARSDSAAILLTEWPGGITFELGRADFHGRWAQWHETPISAG